MFHKNRRWCLGRPVATAEELAQKLTDTTWTLCTAFVIEGHPDYLFLNDSTHEDGAGEYAVLRRLPEGQLLQIESITFSWCDREKALGYIQEILAGDYDEVDYVRLVTPRLDMPEEHKPCQLCD